MIYKNEFLDASLTAPESIRDLEGRPVIDGRQTMNWQSTSLRPDRFSKPVRSGPNLQKRLLYFLINNLLKACCDDHWKFSGKEEGIFPAGNGDFNRVCFQVGDHI